MSTSIFTNIVIPIDIADKHSIRAVMPVALNFVNVFGAKLHFIHIIPDFGMKMIEDYLPKHWIKDQNDQYQEQIQDIINQYIPGEITVNFHIGRGGVYDEVIHYSNEIGADLIIVAAVRPQLREYMLGPNASKIVRHASVSVMVVRE